MGMGAGPGMGGAPGMGMGGAPGMGMQVSLRLRILFETMCPVFYAADHVRLPRSNQSTPALATARRGMCKHCVAVSALGSYVQAVPLSRRARPIQGWITIISGVG